MKTSTEARAIELGEYIVESDATVRNAAKKFGISKSTVHTAVKNRTVLSKGGARYSYSVYNFIQKQTTA